MPTGKTGGRNGNYYELLTGMVSKDEPGPLASTFLPLGTVFRQHPEEYRLPVEDSSSARWAQSIGEKTAAVD